MVGRLWPTPTGMLATAATAASFHATPFWTAVFSTLVGGAVSVVGFVLQYRYRRNDKNSSALAESQAALLRAKDEVILLQLGTIDALHLQLTGGHIVETVVTGGDPILIDPSDAGGV